MAVDEPRPNAILNDLMRRYPHAGESIETYLRMRGNDLPEWPTWCFLPMAGFMAIATGQNRPTPENISDGTALAAVGTWRYSQGIYRFDEAVLQALVASPVTGNIPSAVLYRMPEWCMYIETPGMDYLGMNMYGFFVHMEWDANTERHELRFLIDTDDGVISNVLHVGNMTIEESLGAVADVAATEAKGLGVAMNKAAFSVNGTMTADLSKMLSLVLYLTSKEPEIDNDRQPGVSPQYPAPKKTKKGWRLFPAPGPRFWNIGQPMGEKLRQSGVAKAVDEEKAQSELGKPGTRTMITHLRKGHWHGFWKGPCNGEREFEYKWLPPTLINAENNNDNDKGSSKHRPSGPWRPCSNENADYLPNHKALYIIDAPI